MAYTETLTSHSIFSKLTIFQMTEKWVPEEVEKFRIVACHFTDCNDDEFEKFCNVIEINASENNLNVICFRKFNSLKYLNLSLNTMRKLQLRNVGESVEDFLKHKFLIYLEDLDLSFNSLKDSVFDELRLLPHLTNLVLSHNEISLCDVDLKKTLPFFPNLSNLHLEHNNIANYGVLSYIPHLKMLYLQNNPINSMKTREFPHLIFINLHSTNINDIPTDIKIICPKLLDMDIRKTKTSGKFIKEYCGIKIVSSPRTNIMNSFDYHVKPTRIPKVPSMLEYYENQQPKKKVEQIKDEIDFKSQENFDISKFSTSILLTEGLDSKFPSLKKNFKGTINTSTEEFRDIEKLVFDSGKFPPPSLQDLKYVFNRGMINVNNAYILLQNEISDPLLTMDHSFGKNRVSSLIKTTHLQNIRTKMNISKKRNKLKPDVLSKLELLSNNQSPNLKSLFSNNTDEILNEALEANFSNLFDKMNNLGTEVENILKDEQEKIVSTQKLNQNNSSILNHTAKLLSDAQKEYDDFKDVVSQHQTSSNVFITQSI
eukprot:TRINITY_DN928_c0_g1_i1.p1 TRINITY_DN928_c0_g1~~TRINITY_DN928_c0_g1_i1.p1  ORF type:complete len:551 (+),score=159.53 TRINITY_DN928_c0_g1_i1:32-1654(+)